MRFKTCFLKYGWLSVCLYISSPLLAQTRIPDQNFAVAIYAACPTCIDPGTNNLLPPAATLTTLNVNNKKIADLTGISGFTNLQTLRCDSNSLVTLPALPLNLKELSCGGNLIRTLNTLPITLNYLDCRFNKLSSLPALPNNLIELTCVGNTVSNLPTLPNSLVFLDCSGNGISILPKLPDSLLGLSCYSNDITILPKLPPNLLSFSCVFNQITLLQDLPSKIIQLFCYGNKLNCLPNLPVSLKDLRIDAQKIACLPNLPDGLKVYNLNAAIPTPPVCTTPCSVSATSAQSLVAYYPFNGNVNDESGNNNNGTVNRATLAADRFGNANKAYSFADGNSIVVKNSSSLKLTNAFSYSVWVSMKSTQGRDGNGALSNYGYHTILTKDCDRDNFYSTISITQNNIFSYSSGTWKGSVTANNISFTVNTWTHFATTFDGKTIKLFQNGSLISKKDTTINFTASNAADLYIGKMGCYAYFFNGSIDDLSIYNTALTDTEVQQIYILIGKWFWDFVRYRIA